MEKATELQSEQHALQAEEYLVMAVQDYSLDVVSAYAGLAQAHATLALYYQERGD